MRHDLEGVRDTSGEAANHSGSLGRRSDATTGSIEVVTRGSGHRIPREPHRIARSSHRQHAGRCTRNRRRVVGTEPCDALSRGGGNAVERATQKEVGPRLSKRPDTGVAPHRWEKRRILLERRQRRCVETPDVLGERSEPLVVVTAVVGALTDDRSCLKVPVGAIRAVRRPGLFVGQHSEASCARKSHRHEAVGRVQLDGLSAHAGVPGGVDCAGRTVECSHPTCAGLAIDGGECTTDEDDITVWAARNVVDLAPCDLRSPGFVHDSGGAVQFCDDRLVDAADRREAAADVQIVTQKRKPPHEAPLGVGDKAPDVGACDGVEGCESHPSLPVDRGEISSDEENTAVCRPGEISNPPVDGRVECADGFTAPSVECHEPRLSHRRRIGCRRDTGEVTTNVYDLADSFDRPHTTVHGTPHPSRRSVVEGRRRRTDRHHQRHDANKHHDAGRQQCFGQAHQPHTQVTPHRHPTTVPKAPNRDLSIIRPRSPTRPRSSSVLWFLRWSAR